MTTISEPDDLTVVVESIIDLGASLSQLVAHMTESRERTVDAAGRPAVTIPERLAGLLDDTFQPVSKLFTPESMADIAGFLNLASIAVATEIFMVPIEPAPRNRSERRKRRP